MSEPERDPDLLELEVGPVAHGGSCVARHDGRVVFVRHALPGELVLARLDRAEPPEGASAPGDEAADRRAGQRYWRADAVQILRASPDRVEPRCAVSGPGGCGGCDWQHASLSGQRAGKAAVIAEQLKRLAGIVLPELGLPEVVVEPVPGDDAGLGWRTRVRFTVNAAGRPGLRAHRSHAVVPVEHCPIAHPAVDAPDVGSRTWPRTASVEVVAAIPVAGQPAADPLVIVEPAVEGAIVSVPPLAVSVSVARRTVQGLQRVRGRTWLEQQVLVDGEVRRFRVTGSGFWQVHPGAAQTLLDAVLAATDPRPGERAVDLYSGVGLFVAGLAARVGPAGAVLGIEGDSRSCADARRSLHDVPQVTLEQGRVERVLGQATAGEPWRGRADVVVLDPPRSGAGRSVVEAVVALAPRVVGYVACDPAALARDAATFAAIGYRLTGLRAFDLFPMTHHVECLATFSPASGHESGPGDGVAEGSAGELS